jgi:hypothetical protein
MTRTARKHWKIKQAKHSEKKLEDEASKEQKVLAQVKRVHPSHTARECVFFSTKTSFV